MRPPAIQLFRYQLDWLNDWSRFKIMLKSRQTGITFVETLGIVQFLLSTPRQRWHYVSISQDRADDAVDYARLHCEAIGVGVESETVKEVIDGVEFTKRFIKFPNGSIFIALPANPRTVRGINGHVTLDEYAFHLFDKKIWASVAPSSSWGFHVHVISTANGEQGDFYDKWTAKRKYEWHGIENRVKHGDRMQIVDGWSRHWVDVHTAIEQGHPITIQEAKLIAGDELTFQQEYCCQFISENVVLLPYKLIEQCTDDTGLYTSKKLPDKNHGIIYGGYDVGRKRDLSVLFALEKEQSGRKVQRACLELEQSKYKAQEMAINDHMARIASLHIDTNGIGDNLGETARNRWGSKITKVSLTGDMSRLLAAETKRVFEEKEILIADDEKLRSDLHSITRSYTNHGRITYDAPHTKDGHADRFWALALALNAARGGVAKVSELKTQKRAERSAWG